MLKQMQMLECQSLICSAADEKSGNAKMKRAMWKAREQLATNDLIILQWSTLQCIYLYIFVMHVFCLYRWPFTVSVLDVK